MTLLDAVGRVPSTGRGSAPRRQRRRPVEPWRDAVLLGVATHAVLLVAALTRPGAVPLLVLAVLLGGTLGVGTLTVLHDAGHGMFSPRAWPNVLAVQLAVPAGLWVGHWGLKHRAHHRMVQVYPLDEATRASGAVRLHPEAPLRPVHRYQHLYAWALYGLAWAGELRSQLRYLRTGAVVGTRTPQLGQRVRSFAAEKTLWVLVLLPYALLLGAGRLAVLLLVAETVASVIAGVLTVVGHVSVGLEPLPGPPGERWTEQVVRTTASFSTDSGAARWLTGGLTHHLAHHLRPVALRSELPALHTTLVRETAGARGLPVVEYPTLWSAVRAHHRRLVLLGRPDPA